MTGIGLKTPGGHHLKDVLNSLHAGKSTASTVPELLEGGSPVTFACTVPPFDLTPYCSPREQRRMERPAMLALAAARDAVGQSGLDVAAAPDAVGVAVGTGFGGLSAVERIVGEVGRRPDQVSPMAVPRVMPSSPADCISLKLAARGSSLTYSAACASGAIAIGESMLKIRSGELTAVVAGGVDAGVTPVAMSAFARMRVLSTRNDDPGSACRPFDEDRDGFVMGEGAAFLVLENWDHAMARGATILGEVAGYGSNSDAHHVVAPLEDGSMAARCIDAALADAGLGPQDIGHISANGTSTWGNDAAEARAIAQSFGTLRPPVTAVKGVLGHLVGGAGAVQAAVALAVAADGEVPPVANHHRGEEPGLLDVVAGAPRRIARAAALSNSFGFGGHNACLVLSPGR
ncbi:beta-ketoacyl-[acyl-carrier-protein] synthase family protein [Streptomyces sp. NPDC001933]|uniref:beta-ketoacyl-[acyl-carrier-protein] synthase family protein n=1 Tax=Streptomyces sp. NPDC001933 TaxID=3364626 RepID=UPI0036851C08